MESRGRSSIPNGSSADRPVPGGRGAGAGQGDDEQEEDEDDGDDEECEDEDEDDEDECEDDDDEEEDDDDEERPARGNRARVRDGAEASYSGATSRSSASSPGGKPAAAKAAAQPARRGSRSRRILQEAAAAPWNRRRTAVGRPRRSRRGWTQPGGERGRRVAVGPAAPPTAGRSVPPRRRSAAGEDAGTGASLLSVTDATKQPLAARGWNGRGLQMVCPGCVAPRIGTKKLLRRK